MGGLKTADFDYELPEELIAQQPAARREDARLLVVHRATHTLEHRRFFELPQFLGAGDLLIRNTARVRAARLFAQRAGGGQVECLLLRPANADACAGRVATPAQDVAAESRSGTRAGPGTAPAMPAPERWWCLLRPGRRLPPGAGFGVAGEFAARVVAKSPTAEYVVEFVLVRPDDTVAALAERLGQIPLPPYIRRPPDHSTAPGAAPAADPTAPTAPTVDRERYQTVFADREQTVAVAAPTAGLHFSAALLERLASGGVEFANVILHVGLGTFRPIETEDVAQHPIHRETIVVPAATRERLLAAGSNDPARARRRIAVGTTAVRAIEHYARAACDAGAHTPKGDPASAASFATSHDRVDPSASAAQDFVAEADLFLHPPAEFRMIDGLITNFHLPRSTLLCLVAAFLAPGTTTGVAWLREIYAEAIRERYRFLSYGDAMLIL